MSTSWLGSFEISLMNGVPTDRDESAERRVIPGQHTCGSEGLIGTGRVAGAAYLGALRPRHLRFDHQVARDVDRSSWSTYWTNLLASGHLILPTRDIPMVISSAGQRCWVPPSGCGGATVWIPKEPERDERFRRSVEVSISRHTSSHQSWTRVIERARQYKRVGARLDSPIRVEKVCRSSHLV